MITISSRADLKTWLDNTRSDIEAALGEEAVEEVLDNLLDEDHPAYDSDWETWLNSSDTKELIQSVVDEIEDDDDEVEDDEEGWANGER